MSDISRQTKNKETESMGAQLWLFYQSLLQQEGGAGKL